jgi:hypothetical protein
MMSAPSRPGLPPHSPLTRMAEGYWVESQRPLASLVFIAPLLVTYETGLLVLGRHAVQNGADVWLRSLLHWLGFTQYFLLPILTVCILLGWHYTTRQSWRISQGLLWGMAGECLLLAICLRVLLQIQSLVVQAMDTPPGMSLSVSVSGVGATVGATVGAAVGFLGAGIYEELLFRLILLSLLAWGLKRAGAGPQKSMVAAVLLVSLLFAGAHYVGQYGETLRGFSFLFRFLAGIFFSVLFVYRGFGIVAGAHAGYNILVGLLA